MRRVCFVMQMKPDRLAEYRARHRAVWPEMVTALRQSGWHNYSIFLREDGLLVGYFETPSLERALADMAATEVNVRWQAQMQEFFLDLGEQRPDQAFHYLDEIFNLDDTLEATTRTSATADVDT